MCLLAICSDYASLCGLKIISCYTQAVVSFMLLAWKYSNIEDYYAEFLVYYCLDR